MSGYWPVQSVEDFGDGGLGGFLVDEGLAGGARPRDTGRASSRTLRRQGAAPNLHLIVGRYAYRSCRCKASQTAALVGIFNDVQHARSERAGHPVDRDMGARLRG